MLCFNLRTHLVTPYIKVLHAHTAIFVYNHTGCLVSFAYTYTIMKLNAISALSRKILLAIMSLGLFLLMVTMAQAQTPPDNIPTAGVELDGYMWSDTIGWISMNCKTGSPTGGDICATSNYSVKILGTNSGSSTTGDLLGYAWSDNIGWVKFSPQYLSGFPIASGNVQESANVTGDYTGILALRGWARACAGTASGGCGTMTSRADGWDGWISMRGTGIDGGGVPFSYGSSFSAGGTVNNSFGWGGTVVGWLSLDQVTYVDLTPSATVSGSGCTIPEGQGVCNSLFTWSILNASGPIVRNLTTNNTYSNAVSGTNVPHSIEYGDNTIAARDGSDILASIDVTATCESGTAYDVASSVCVLIPPIVAPAVTMSINKRIARVKDIVTVSWTITPAPPASPASCALTGPGLTGTTVSSSGSRSSNPLTSKSKFTITCTGVFGSVGTSTEIEVIPVAKEV